MEPGNLPTVLLVEPPSERRQELEAKLANAGFAVVVAETGDQALAACPEADIVVANFELGETDGAQLTVKLKEGASVERFLPILLTGDNRADDRVRAFAAGCDDFVGHDISFFELDARVRALLQHRDHHLQLAQANEQLRELQAKKRNLAALMVHDLRNPLSALQGHLELLDEELGDTKTETVASSISDCHTLVRKALVMCGGILDVEELERGLLVAEPKPVRLDSFLRQTSRHHRVPIEVRKLSLKYDVADGLSAHFDEELVGRVVENLLDNAVRYAPFKGTITLSAGLKDGELTIRVGNDGPAVPEEDRDKIFTRYYRIEARRAGARANRGLGLYFCRLVAEAHGGSISFEERPDVAASFAFRVPQPAPASAT